MYGQCVDPPLLLVNAIGLSLDCTKCPPETLKVICSPSVILIIEGENPLLNVTDTSAFDTPANITIQIANELTKNLFIFESFIF